MKRQIDISELRCIISENVKEVLKERDYKETNKFCDRQVSETSRRQKAQAAIIGKK